MTPKGHIVYDCDGTLVTTMDGVYKLMESFFTKHLEREVTREEVIRKMDYNSLKTLENFGIDCNKVHTAFLQEWAVFNTKREEKYSLFEGMDKCLRHFQEQGYAQYVWTGRERYSTKAILKHIGFDELFVDIRCRDDCEPKPHVEGLEEMLYDVDPAHIVVIGDTYADMIGAKNFKAHAIGCTWCENARIDILEEFGADVILNKPLELIDYIESYFKRTE
jgi:phosphoglycolate phosphatase